MYTEKVFILYFGKYNIFLVCNFFTMVSECKKKKTQHEYTACRKNQLFECKRKIDFSDKQRSVIYTSDERCVDEANRWKHRTEK